MNVNGKSSIGKPLPEKDSVTLTFELWPWKRISWWPDSGKYLYTSFLSLSILYFVYDFNIK